MFSGIIQSIGTVLDISEQGGDRRLSIEAGGLDLSGVRPGDSIAVSGVCLTVIELDGTWFTADVSRETLQVTTLAQAVAGQPVNLEKALVYGARVGGHLVAGHVDGIGRMLERHGDARSVRMRFAAPGLGRYLARKGAICVDGVSLTVNAVDGETFEVNLVPHTLQRTTLAGMQPGSTVNLEVDLIARYVERMLSGYLERS